jgi:hypothetical protein
MSAIGDRLKAVFGSAWHVNATPALEQIATEITNISNTPTGTVTYPDAANIAVGTTTGTQIGTTTLQKVGFFATTPAVQPTSGSEAAVTVHTITTASTTSSPAGYATTTQATAVATDLAATVTLVNQLRADLVTLGLIKGA